MMEAFFATFFILGSFWFWITGIVVFGAIIGFAEHEQNFWAAAVVGVFVGGILYFNEMLTIDWSMVPWYILGYLVLGLLMTYIKWISYLKLRADRFAILKLKFAYEYTDRHDLPEIDASTNMKQVLDDSQFGYFKKFLGSQRFISHHEPTVIPQWKDKVSKLVSWGLWWPAVIFWTILNDPISRMFRALIEMMRSWYEGLAAKIFANVGVDASENKDYNEWR